MTPKEFIEMTTRFNCNLGIKDKTDCQVCNPIKPCSKSSICSLCLQWLQRKD